MATADVSPPGGAATPKSPELAWLVSLVLPGAGQLYCGKASRGLWTLVFFALALAGVIFLYAPMLGSNNRGLEFLWGGALRTALVLYVFAFLDAYLTAREINSGVDSTISENPRVAAVLNLLTRGFGYWYLGEKKKGILLFVLLGAASRAAMRMENEALGNWLSFGVEIVMAVMAVDAYRLGRKERDERLAVVRPTPAAVQTDAGLPAAVPLGLAGLLGLGYVGLVTLGLLMPSYDNIDQSGASLREQGEEKIYLNPAYGVQLRVPTHWEFDRDDPDYFVEAVTYEGGCRVGLLPDATLPFLSVESAAANLIRQLQAQRPDFRLLGQDTTLLANLPAHEVMFSADVQGTEVVQHYVLARRGLSLYVLIITAAGDLIELCQDDIDRIRQGVSLAQ